MLTTWNKLKGHESLQYYIEKKPLVQKALDHGLEEVTTSFLALYEKCISLHGHPSGYYQRGKIFFDQGKTIEFLDDVASLIGTGNAKDYLGQNSTDCLAIGRGFAEANLYNQAIKALTQAIEKDPSNNEAYFERAIVYFEIGNFNLAFVDYLQSGVRPKSIQSIDDTGGDYSKFALGIGLGCLKGGSDSAVDFVPSLFASAYGLGKGLWAFASDPIGVSKDFVDSCKSCIEFLKENISSELLVQIMPELKECLELWDHLDENKKGYYVGYVIGRYGVDFLAWGGCVKGLKLFRDLKRANPTLTLESATASPKNLENLIAASEEHFKNREAFKKKCKLHRGQQEKHIVGTNNFQLGKSELTISLERMEQLASSRLGQGIPSRFTFGEAGYKEIIDFGEEIGIHVHKDTKMRTPTSIGEIHYDKVGNYHIVPIYPKCFKE